MSNPLVSILMTAYNREKLIGPAIESVLASTYSDLELIIVDDRSSDSTVGIANDLAARDGRIKVFINEKNLVFFEKLQRGKNQVDSLFTLLLPDNTLYSHLGKLSIIDRAVDAQTGSVRVRLVFDNAEKYLRPGRSVRPLAGAGALLQRPV